MARGPRPGSTAGRTPRVAGQRRAPSPASTAPPTYAPPPQTEPHRTGPVSTPPATTEPKVARPGWRERLGRLRLRLPHGRPAAAWRASATHRGVIAIALITLIVVFGTLTGLYLQGYLHARSVQNARDDAVAAAKVGVPHLASYSYKTFDADVRTTDKYLTPAYRKQYDDFQQKAVRATALKYHAQVTAEVTYAGVAPHDASTGRVQLLVFLNQTTTSTRIPAPRLSQSRLHVDMRNVGGKWLIAGVATF
jgi:Mce-associated membrane protein